MPQNKPDQENKRSLQRKPEDIEERNKDTGRWKDILRSLIGRNGSVVALKKFVLSFDSTI